MSSQTPNQPDRPDDGLPQDVIAGLSAAAQIRAAADGEIGPAPDAAPEHAAGVRFESSLRAAVGRAMSEPTSAPASLRSAVEASFGAKSSDVVTTPLGNTADRSFWASFRSVSAPLAAVAAVLVLAAVLVVPGLFSGGSALPGEQFTRISTFVSSQHQGCLTDTEVFGRKFTARSPEQAAALSERVIGAAPGLLLPAGLAAMRDAGYTLLGVGGCGVPGSGASVHVAFTHGASEPEARPAPPGAAEPGDRDAGAVCDDVSKAVSVFIQQDTGELDLSTASCYLASCDKTQITSLVVWRANGFVHYVYCRDRQGLDAARAAMQAPAAEQRL